MNENEIINKALLELKSSEKPYLMFKDFSFLKGKDMNDDQIKKIKYLLIKSAPFERHATEALKLSTLGLEIASNHKDWFAYRKSLKPKIDYAKWIAVGIAGLSLTWNVFQGISKSNLREENRELGNEVEALQKENAGLQQNFKKMNQ